MTPLHSTPRHHFATSLKRHLSFGSTLGSAAETGSPKCLSRRSTSGTSAAKLVCPIWATLSSNDVRMSDSFRNSGESSAKTCHRYTVLAVYKYKLPRFQLAQPVNWLRQASAASRFSRLVANVAPVVVKPEHFRHPSNLCVCLKANVV